MNCQICGTPLAEGTKFCPKCGRAVQAAPAGGPRPKRVQPQRQAHPAGQPGNNQNPKGSTPQKKKIDGRRIAVIVSGIVLVFVIALVVLLFAFRNMREKDDQLLGPDQQESREEEPENSQEHHVILSEPPAPSQSPAESPKPSVTGSPAPVDLKDEVVADLERASRIYQQWIRGRTGTTRTSISETDPETNIELKDGASFYKMLSSAFSTRYVNDCLSYMGIKRTDSLLMLPDAPTSNSGSFLPANAVYEVTKITSVNCKVKVSWTDADNKTWEYYLDASKGGEHWVFDDLPTEVGIGQWGFFGSYRSAPPSPTPSPSRRPTTTPVITTPTPIPTPSPAPTPTPTPSPSVKPSPSPSTAPSPSPSVKPSPSPSAAPSPSPSVKPSPSPSTAPSPSPSVKPSPSPSAAPSPSPSAAPSPSVEPSEEPSPSPSVEPSEEPSPSPSPEVVISHTTVTKTATNAAGAEIGQVEIPEFSSATYDSDPHAKAVVDGMNAARDTLSNTVLNRCKASETLTACTVSAQVLENSDYVSVLLKGTYTDSATGESTIYDGLILDKETGSAVSVTTVLGMSEDAIQGQIGGSWQAAVVHGGSAEFYLPDGTTKTIPLP